MMTACCEMIAENVFLLRYVGERTNRRISISPVTSHRLSNTERKKEVDKERGGISKFLLGESHRKDDHKKPHRGGVRIFA